MAKILEKIPDTLNNKTVSQCLQKTDFTNLLPRALSLIWKVNFITAEVSGRETSVLHCPENYYYRCRHAGGLFGFGCESGEESCDSISI